VRVRGVALFTVIVHDRTEAMQFEKAQRYQALAFTQITDAVVLTDAEGQIRDCNPAAEETFGWTREQLLGQTIRLLYGGSDPVNGACWKGECAFTRQDGTRGVCELVSVPLQERGEAAGSATGTLRVHRDITRLVQIEQEWQRAREDAAAASRAKLAFLASASHEIRTPLHGVLTAAQLLRESPLDPNQCRRLHCLEVSAQRLERLLDQVLTFSELEAGTLHLESLPFALRGLLSRTLAPLVGQAQEKHLRLELHIADEVPEYLVGDPTRLSQVLGHLVGHAIQSTEQGEVVVQVSLAACGLARAEAAIDLRFTVCDTGSGLSPEGAGLGWTICERLIRLLGGQLTLASQPEEGSSFQFTLRFPLCCPLVGAAGLRTPDGSLSALLVLGDPGERELFEPLLSRLGYQTTVLSSGREALTELCRALVVGRPFSLVLVTQALPQPEARELIHGMGEFTGLVGQKTVVVRDPGCSAEQNGWDACAPGVIVVDRPVCSEQLAQVLGRQAVSVS
jgi:signal transduction histidine kinase